MDNADTFQPDDRLLAHIQFTSAGTGQRRRPRTANAPAWIVTGALLLLTTTIALAYGAL